MTVLPVFTLRSDFMFDVMIPVCRVQARECVPGHRFGQIPAQLADWPIRRFSRDMHVLAIGDEHLRQVYE